MADDTQQSPASFRTFLMEEMKNANKMLTKYETKLLDSEQALEGEALKMVQEGVAHWRSVSSQVRAQLFETKTALK